MFLHVGGTVDVYKKDIIAIMDLETTTISKDSKEFLKVAEEEGFIFPIGDDLPKTFVIVEDEGRNIVYLSPISSATLYKRSLSKYI